MRTSKISAKIISDFRRLSRNLETPQINSTAEFCRHGNWNLQYERRGSQGYITKGGEIAADNFKIRIVGKNKKSKIKKLNLRTFLFPKKAMREIESMVRHVCENMSNEKIRGGINFKLNIDNIIGKKSMPEFNNYFETKLGNL